MQTDNGDKIAISTGHNQTCANCDTVIMTDSAQQNQVTLVLPFGAGQANDIGSNLSLSGFTVMATVSKLNSGDANITMMPETNMNCTAKLISSGGAKAFFSGLGPFWVNLIAGLADPQFNN